MTLENRKLEEHRTFEHGTLEYWIKMIIALKQKTFEHSRLDYYHTRKWNIET